MLRSNPLAMGLQLDDVDFSRKHVSRTVLSAPCAVIFYHLLLNMRVNQFSILVCPRFSSLYKMYDVG